MEVYMDPIDIALAGKVKLAAERKDQDHALWHAWKQDPNEDNMHALMTRFEPVFRSKVQQYKAPNVSTAAFRANLKIQAINAFQTYDPSKAALRTHLDNHLRKSMRFNAQHQNYAYIPEGQTAYIGPIDRAIEAHIEDFGEEPTHLQIAQRINADPELLGGKKPLTATMVARVQSNRRKDILGSSFEGETAAYTVNRNEQVQGLLLASITNPLERKVFEHTYGVNGAPQVSSSTQLAKKLGVSISQISRMKSAIATKYKKHL